MTLDDYIDDGYEIEKSATPGTWEAEKVYDETYSVELPPVNKKRKEDFIAPHEYDNRFIYEDAIFIADARTRITKYRQIIDAMRKHFPVNTGITSYGSISIMCGCRLSFNNIYSLNSHVEAKIMEIINE